MRVQLSSYSLLILCFAVVAAAQSPAAAVPTCADLHLVPAVRECTAVRSLSAASGVTVVLPSRDRANHDLAEKDAQAFVRQDLSAWLNNRGLSPYGEAQTVVVYLLLSDDALAKQLLTQNSIRLEAGMHDEGYAIVPHGKGIAVIAETSAGLFYGAQTVKQLIRGSGKDAVLLVADDPRLAGDGASGTERRLVARAAAEHGVSEARNPHAGGVQDTTSSRPISSTRLRTSPRRLRRFRAER